MPLRLPGLRLTAEYRGVQPGGEFTNRENGENVVFGPKLKFELEDPETGDVVLVPLRGSDFDRLEPPFDHAMLKKGDVLELELTAVLGTGDNERSYLQLKSAQLAGGKVKPLAAATG